MILSNGDTTGIVGVRHSPGIKAVDKIFLINTRFNSNLRHSLLASAKSVTSPLFVTFNLASPLIVSMGKQRTL